MSRTFPRVMVVTALTMLLAFSTNASCKNVVVKKQYITDCDTGGEYDFCQIWSGVGGYGHGKFTAKGSFDGIDCGITASASPVGQNFCIYRDDFVSDRGDELWAFNAQACDANGAFPCSGLHYVEGGTGRFAGANGTLFIYGDTSGVTIKGQLCGLRIQGDD